MFPKDEVVKRKWAIALRLGKEVSKYMCVCSVHFKNSDFIAYDHVNLRRRLKKGVVPSCNLPLRSQDKVSTAKQLVAKAKRTARVNARNAEREAKPVSIIQSECRDRCGGSMETDVAEDIPRFEEQEAAEALLELQSALMNVKETTNDSEIQAVCAEKVKVIPSTVASKKKVTLIDMLVKDSDLNAFTGISTFKQLESISQAAELMQVTESNSKLLLDVTERIVLTMCKIKLNISFTCIAILFGISCSTCTSYFYLTCELLGAVLECAVVWPSKENIMKNMPECFAQFKRTRIVLDCTETPVHKPKCLKCRLSTYSHYKGTNTIKFLIGIAPDGLITYYSAAYGGRASDKAIFLQSNLLSLLDPINDAIMADKGFLIEHECMQRGIELIRPPFLGKHKQFSQEDAIRTADIARARVHVERTIQRIKIFSIFSSPLEWNLVAVADQIMNIVGGMVNLSNPVMAMDKF